jgi:hypothetical protein
LAAGFDALATGFDALAAGFVTLAAGFDAFAGAFLGDDFEAVAFAADLTTGFAPDFTAGFAAGFTDFFTLEDTGLTGFWGRFGPFDAPDFTTDLADALEAFAFITAFVTFLAVAFLAAAGDVILLGFPFDALGLGGAFLRAPMDELLAAFFFADGMGLGGCWVGSPSLNPMTARREVF